MTKQGNHPKPLFTSWKELLVDLLFILSGNVLCAIAVNGILIPNEFVTGGVTGISLIINSMVPFLNVGLIYFLINIPIFVIGWMKVGKRFFFYSIVGAASLSVILAFVNIEIHLNEPILYSLMAGMLYGIGVGLVLRSPGSQGGLDILSVILLKKFSVSFGNTVLTINIIILLFVGVFFSLESVLHTVIVFIVSSKLVNIVLTGLSQRKSVMVISDHWEKISKEILKNPMMGVTIISGEGGYMKNGRKILYIVVSLMSLGRIKKLILEVDPDAFIVISGTQEVINYRIGNQPHW